MNAKECADRFSERYKKLLSGEIIPGSNNCSEPFDSHWEKDFEWVLAKQIPDFINLRNQVWFGRFRVDFAFQCSQSGKVWIVEFDGKAYHDAAKDRERDRVIFHENPQVQAIVRVDAKTGYLEPDETRAMLAQLLPECFATPCTPMHKWTESGGVYTARIFDSREDEDCWWDDGAHLPGAPMIDMKIVKKTRP